MKIDHLVFNHILFYDVILIDVGMRRVIEGRLFLLVVLGNLRETFKMV